MKTKYCIVSAWFYPIHKSSKLAGGLMPEASKIGLGLVKIPKQEVCLACVIFVVSIFASAVESFVKLLFVIFKYYTCRLLENLIILR